MKVSATNKTALWAGIWSGVVGMMVQPFVDRPGILPSAITVVMALLVAAAGYFFVFDVRRSEMQGGLWFFEPNRLKRTAFFLVGVIAVCAMALAIIRFVRGLG